MPNKVIKCNPDARVTSTQSQESHSVKKPKCDIFSKCEDNTVVVQLWFGGIHNHRIDYLHEVSVSLLESEFLNTTIQQNPVESGLRYMMNP